MRFLVVPIIILFSFHEAKASEMNELMHHLDNVTIKELFPTCNGDDSTPKVDNLKYCLAFIHSYSNVLAGKVAIMNEELAEDKKINCKAFQNLDKNDLLKINKNLLKMVRKNKLQNSDEKAYLSVYAAYLNSGYCGELNKDFKSRWKKNTKNLLLDKIPFGIFFKD